MAKIKPEYEELPEFIEILEKIVELYPSVFPNIDPEQIAAVQITNKPRPESRSQVWDLKAVNPPLTIFCPKRYFVTLYTSDWEVFSEEHKAAVVSDVLFSISPELDGKIVPFDKKDHSVILRTLGVDYMNEGRIPNILSGDVKWKI
jgi:hypothetical protein